MEAIYARQSVDKVDSLSIQAQIDLCRQKTEGEVKVYQDRGFSGKNTNRPAFQSMMEAVERGELTKIIVYRLDRFSRSIADFGRLWEILKAHRVEFVSINETFDTSTPMGRAMLNIIMVFAQLERETTAERVRDNYYHRAKLGAWPGGPAPYGFSIGRSEHPAPMPMLVPDDHASVVETIFRLYAQLEASLGSVARELTRQGISGPKREAWDNVTLSRILHSPLYVMADADVFLYYTAKGLQMSNPMEDFDGLHAAMLIGKRDRSAGKYQDVKEQHLSLANHYGLIPADLWLRCQYKLDQNRQIGRSGKGQHTWLSGLMKCASCGYSVKVLKDGEKYYLICSGRSNLKVCHQSIRIDLRTLEENVAGELERLLVQCPDVKPEEDDDRELTDKLAEIDRKIDRLMDALAESDQLSMPYVNRTIQRLEEEKATLLQNRERQRQRPGSQLRRVEFDRLEFEQKKVVAAEFIQEIRLSEDTAEVIWKV